ncbi:MAG: SpaA isopeptide-forming pilin-related protein [Oscillospiraceae bacterium]|nr:SpaA isopeptide-forming pilin-related protein [Oscillospiraceae bacterium]
MKKFKRFAAAMAAVLLTTCISLAGIPNSKINAAGGNTVTISNTADGHTYKAYQVFAAVLDKTSSDPIFTDIQWGSGVDSAALLAELKGNTLYVLCDTAADVAGVLSTASAEQIDDFAHVVSKHTTSVAIPSVDEGDTYSISGLDDGYYFIKDSSAVTGQDSYTKYILKVTDNMSLIPKSSVPSVIKKVKEDSKFIQDDGYGAGYNDVADYCIGEAVPFKLIGTMPSTLDYYDHYYYKFTDTLGPQFTAPSADGITIMADGKEVAANKFNIHVQVNADTGVISIEIEDIKALKDTSGDLIKVTVDSIITVEFSAVLNSSAEIGLPGQENKVFLTFSNNPNEEYNPVTDKNNPETPGGTDDNNDTPSDQGQTPEDEVIVFTYELDTTKVDGKDTEIKLDGAKFKLKNADENFARVDENGVLTGWDSIGTELVSNEQGLFMVKGLDDDTYWLVETSAPAGYNLLADPIKVVISAATENNQKWSGVPSDALTALSVTAAGNPGTADADTGIAQITVANNKGITLPGTGGIGTTIFYIAGGVIAAGSGVLLVTKKRTEKNEE